MQNLTLLSDFNKYISESKGYNTKIKPTPGFTCPSWVGSLKNIKAMITKSLRGFFLLQLF
jgi:hypothetical protein